MGLFEQIDLLARGGAIALLALWSWMLLRDHRSALAARLAVAMNAAICCYILVTTGWYSGRTVPGFGLALGAGLSAALFWLFARAWFNDHHRVSRLGWLLLALALLNIAVVQLSFPDGGLVYRVSAIVFRVNQFAFALAALWEVWRGRAGDLVEGRRRLRSLLVGSVAIYVALIAFTESSAQAGYLGSDVLRGVSSGAVVVIFAFCAAMLGMRQNDLFAAAAGPAPVPPTARPPRDESDPLALRLRAHMATDLPHRDETLSIAALAAQLGEPEYRLRRVINGSLGYRNFAQFINGYRLAEVKAALADPAQRDVPIITIALDAGFGSLGPFNRAFRDAEGVTPSEWRSAQAGASSTDSGNG